MKKLLLASFSICCILTLCFGATAWADEKDKEAARVPLENYLKGQATGDPEFMRKAFHTEGNMTFVRDGKFVSISFTDFINGFKGKPAPDENKRKRWIDSVEVTGNSGTGKIILDYPNGKFTDYMTLLKINGEWKIVNKSFHFEPRAQTAK